MCEKVVENEPYSLKFVPNHFKTQEMCDKAVRDDTYSLQYVPDWFVTRERAYMCYGDDEDNFFKWYDSYKKQKTQKAKIKGELLPITWHPLRWWDWCVPENEKSNGEKLWA